jgi:hypothetical protein
VHSNICELNGILTRGGNRYFITFIDDCSRYTYVYLMRSKDEAFNKFKCYKFVVENQMEKKIKILRRIEVENIFQLNLSYTAKKMTLYIKEVQPIPHSKMVLQKEKIEH